MVGRRGLPAPSLPICGSDNPRPKRPPTHGHVAFFEQFRGQTPLLCCEWARHRQGHGQCVRLVCTRRRRPRGAWPVPVAAVTISRYRLSRTFFSVTRSDQCPRSQLARSSPTSSELSVPGYCVATYEGCTCTVRGYSHSVSSRSRSFARVRENDRRGSVHRPRCVRCILGVRTGARPTIFGNVASCWPSPASSAVIAIVQRGIQRRVHRSTR